MCYNQNMSKRDEIVGLVADISTCHYLLGIASGFEESAQELRALSGNLFTVGKDTEAKVYRLASESVRKWYAVKRRQYDEETKLKQEKLWVELEKLLESKESK